jgi:hypothetical protein
MPHDFFPTLPEPKREPMDWRTMKAILGGWHGPEIKRPEDD